MAAQRETVVLVHGLYVHGLWMYLLEYWLEQSGYHTVNYSYPSMTRSPAENAEELHAILERLDTSVVHFLAHSMGGLVVRHLFHHYPRQRPGRVVTMGTPHQGSYAARIMHHSGLGYFVGRGLEDGLLGDAPAWAASHQLGSIAGTLNVGLGLLFPGMPAPADGTLMVPCWIIGARTLAEFEIVCVIDHAPRVGIFVIDSDRQGERLLRCLRVGLAGIVAFDSRLHCSILAEHSGAVHVCCKW